MCLPHALPHPDHHNHLDFARSQKPGSQEAFHLSGNISIGIIIYFPLHPLVVYILIYAFRNWNTHGETYKTKCEEGGIAMYPGVEPNQELATDGQNNAQITSFMQAKPSKWTKEGLLEHIIELIVVEDKV